MNDLKGKAMFVAEVALAVAIIALFQSKVMNVPVVGEYLPGFTAR